MFPYKNVLNLRKEPEPKIIYIKEKKKWWKETAKIVTAILVSSGLVWGLTFAAAPSLSINGISNGDTLDAVSFENFSYSAPGATSCYYRFDGTDTSLSQGWNGLDMSDDGERIVGAGFSLTYSADGGDNWNKVSSGNTAFVDVSADGNKIAYISFNNGYVRISNDGGVTSYQATTSGALGWSTLSMSSNGTYLAIAGNTWPNGTYIFTSADGGATWTQRGTTTRQWSDIAISDDGTKLVASVSGGSGGGIYYSADSGATWASGTGVAGQFWNSVTMSADGSKAIATASNNYIYVSNDGGATWTQVTSAGQRSWTSVDITPDGTKAVASVSGGNIYTSTDGGVTWTAQSGSGSRSWSYVALSADGAKMAATVSSGPIYTSSDSGVTWTAHSAIPIYTAFSSCGATDNITPPQLGSNTMYIKASNADGDNVESVTFTYHPISISYPTEGATVGTNDIANFDFDIDPALELYVDFPGGICAYRYEGELGVSTNLRDMGSFYGVDQSEDGNTIIVGGDDVLISKDAGLTWASSTLLNAYIPGVAISKDGTIMAAAPQWENILTSRDGGTTWVSESNSTDRRWSDIAMSDDGGTIIASVQGSYMYVSTSSNVWTELTGSGSRSWRTVGISGDGTTMVGGVNNGYLYTSTSSGATWYAQTSAGSRSWSDIWVSSDGSKIVAVADGGNVYISNDYGVTWTAQTFTSSRNWYGVSSSADGQVMAALGYATKIWLTTNGGTTWTEFQDQNRWGDITISPDGNIITATTEDGDFIRSEDRGVTWKPYMGGYIPFTSCGASGEFEAPQSTGSKTLTVYVFDSNWDIYTKSVTFNYVGATATSTTEAPRKKGSASPKRIAEKIVTNQLDPNNISPTLLELAQQSTTTPLTGSSTVSSQQKIFSRDLSVGSNGEDVKVLQMLLNAVGFNVSASGPGSTGQETTYFGQMTKNALAKLQEALQISPAAGYFGPKTKSLLGF